VGTRSDPHAKHSCSSEQIKQHMPTSCGTPAARHPPLLRRCSDHQILRLALHGSGVVIPMVIQTIQLALSEPNRPDDTPHLTRLDPTGANQSDVERPPTDLAVGGSSPSRSATKTAAQRPYHGIAVVVVGPGEPPCATRLRPRQRAPRVGLRPPATTLLRCCHHRPVPSVQVSAARRPRQWCR
jgi:hypothetical protein